MQNKLNQKWKIELVSFEARVHLECVQKMWKALFEGTTTPP